MKALFAIATLLTLLLFCGPQASASLTAGSLQTYCKDANASFISKAPTFAAGVCGGYILGFMEIADGYIFKDENGKLMGMRLTRNISAHEVSNVFLTFMKSHPEMAEKEAAVVIIVSLVEAKIMKMEPVLEESQTH